MRNRFNQIKMVVERLRLRNGFVAGQDTDMEKLVKHANEVEAGFSGGR